MNTPNRIIPFPHPTVVDHPAARLTRRVIELTAERDQLRFDLDAANARAESLSRPRDRGAIVLAFVVGVMLTVLLRRYVG